MILRWVWRELTHHPRFTAFFTFNLAMGLFGFIALDAFKHSIETSLDEKSQAFMTADVRISGRRELTSQEIRQVKEVLGPESRGLQTKDVYSMAASGKSSRLVQIKVVEPGFPFYGTLETKEQGDVGPEAFEPLYEKNVIWVYPEVLTQLDLELGDKLKIGSIQFQIKDIVLRDAAQDMSGLAPRVYMGSAAMDRTGLIAKKGSSLWYQRLYKIPSTMNLEDTVKRVEAVLDDPAIRVYSHRTSSRQTSRLLIYLNDYLGLVSLAALFLASLGASYLFRNHLRQRLMELATFRSLGLTIRRLQIKMALQLLSLGLLAVLPTLLLSAALLPLMGVWIESLTPFELNVELPWVTVGLSLALSCIGSVMLGWPFLESLKQVKVSQLFQEGSHPQLNFSWQMGVYYVPHLVVFWGLACFQAKSYWVGSLFVITFFGSAVLLGGLCAVILWWASRHWQWPLRGLVRRLVFRHLSRQRLSTISGFLALALGVLLVNFLYLIEGSLQEELNVSQDSRLPNLFLIDIQEEQVSGLKELLQSKRANLSMLSPMVRGRLHSVNGEEQESITINDEAMTREQEQNNRFRNRGFNLSYREKLADSETIIQGEAFPGPFVESQGLPLISVEKDFARRFGWSLGDKLTFDIQGVLVSGRVHNFRKVRWTSFEPNFFVQFQQGVLDEAPKIFLAVIGQLQKKAAQALQNSIVQRFPNISIVDVDRTVKRLLGIILQVSWALKFMAYLSFVAGLFVLYSIALNQIQQRRRDINLMKILGAPFPLLRQSVLAEFATLGFLASSSGVAASFALSYIFSVYVFEGGWTLRWEMALFSLPFVPILCLGLALGAANKVLRGQPKDFF